jgi:hypothetical protein
MNNGATDEGRTKKITHELRKQTWGRASEGENEGEWLVGSGKRGN